MRSNPTLALLLVVLAGATACTHVGNILISPHPRSLRSGKETVQCTTNAVPPPRAALAAPGAEALLPLGLKALEALLAAEAEQYSASYSARFKGFLSGDKACETVLFERAGADGKRSIVITAKIERFGSSAFFLTSVKATTLEGVKSKVASWPLRTLVKGSNPLGGESWDHVVGNVFGFVNPIMILHWVWGLFDDDFYVVDINARLKIQAVHPDKAQLLDLAEVDLPFGKRSIDDLGTPCAPDTGYFPLVSSTHIVPANFTVSVVEGNDLGDVIGKGAKLVKEKKKDILDKAKEVLGLE